MIYRLRYCNKDGIEARVDIQKGLATPVIEVEGTDRPFILSYNNDKGNKSGMFLTSSADIEIYETADFNIDNLKTSNETELSVTYYINNVISWQGFIIPDFFSIEVRNNPVITMTASDRLGTLKNVTLSDLPTMVNLRELAVLCLNKTGLSLPLKTIADFSNDGTVNAFFSYYVDSQRIKDIKGRSISCYDILSSILIASNSKLVQRAGEWVIINKLQHEIGGGKIYSSLSSFTNYLENIYNFDEVSIGARRTIMPVAGSVGIYHEHGGRKSHPVNYDYSLGLSGWNSVNGFVATIENKHITWFFGGTPLFDTERTVKQYLLNYNNWIDDTNNLNTAPYISTDPIQINSPRADRVEVTVDISSTMAEKLSSNTAISFLRYAVILTNGVKTYTLTKAGIFEILDPENISGHSLLLRGGQQPPLLLASPSFSNSDSFKGLFEVGEDDDVNNYSATIRVYGSGNQYVTVNYALIKFSDVSELPKGTMYKTEQGEVFTKAYDIETSIFGDYLLSGLDGYFYRYPNDDTSSIYKDVNTLSSPVWTTPSIPNETGELPLLHHSMRQMRRMFSVAHDLLSAEIEVNDFDPLAIFVACGVRHTVVSAQFDFFKSNLSVELEEVAFQSANVRDFIYSYFGDGEIGIKSIGGISSGTGGGGSTGGGLTPEQLEILSFWKKDPDNPNTIFTEMNAYSKLELSAYGVGDGGGGGGSDYERLDTWASYDSSKAGWVLSALLGNDLNTRVTAIDGRVTDLENSAGGGSVTSVGISVPTGLSVSNSPITSSGVIAIGLQTGYSIPTTVKQGQWDTAYGWGDFRTYGLGVSTFSPSSMDLNDLGSATRFFQVNGAYPDNWDTSYGQYPMGINWYRSALVEAQLAIGYGTSARLVYRNKTDGSNWTTWKGVWSNADFTSTEVTNWNTAFTNSHTHANKTQLDLITQPNIDVLARLSIVNGNLQINGNAYATGELSAYGAGTGGGGGGGLIDTVYGYGNLGQTFNNSVLTDTFNAYTINQINTRLVSVESGSALTVNTTGTGNAITSISKAGSVITANKDLTFSLSNHLHTGVYEPVFSKNTAFNKNFGTTAGTVAEGNHTHSYLPLSGGTLTGNINITPTEGTLGVRTHRVGGSAYMWPYGSSLSSIRTGLGFGWYDTEWIIGNIRSGTADSYGFGIGYRNADGNLNGEFRIAVGGIAYLNNVAIATVNSNVASATKLQTARTIAGVSFDGTANIAIPFANLSSKPTTLAGYGITDAYTKTEVNSALTLKLNKSVFDDLFEKVEVSTGVFAIKAKYNFYGVGEVSAYGFGTGGSGGGSYDRLDAWADYDSTKAGWVLSALLGNELNTRVGNLEGGSALTVNTTGTGNAITSISKSGTVITADKGLTFSLSNHLHSASDITSGIFAIARIPTGTTGTTVALGNHLHTGVYEPVFTKNTAFNKNFGTTAGTVAQGNDSRIINGQTAFGWGDHATAGYALNSAFSTHNNDNVRHITGADRTKWDTVVTDFAGLEIGGRNLLLNSDFSRGFGYYWEKLNNSPSSNFEVVGSTLKATYVEGFKTDFGKTNFVSLHDFSSTEHIIISARIKGNGGLKIRFGGRENPVIQINNDEYKKFTQTIPKSEFGNGNLIFEVSSGELFFDKLKLEKGTIPTDWTPAPEDQVSDWNTTGVNSFSYIKNKPTTLSQFTDNIGVATHIANKTNPHSVTKAQVGLGNVDNTSDLLKPISTATQTALNLKANLASPTFSGVVTAPTFIGALNGNAASATALQTARTIWGQSFNGGADVSGAMTAVTTIAMTGGLSGATTIQATISVATPKVIFNAVGWSMEQVGDELQMKHNDVLKMRFTSTGSIVATEEITAFG